MGSPENFQDRSLWPRLGFSASVSSVRGFESAKRGTVYDVAEHEIATGFQRLTPDSPKQRILISAENYLMTNRRRTSEMAT
jgi:hypothetical protein